MERRPLERQGPQRARAQPVRRPSFLAPAEAAAAGASPSRKPPAAPEQARRQSLQRSRAGGGGQAGSGALWAALRAGGRGPRREAGEADAGPRSRSRRRRLQLQTCGRGVSHPPARAPPPTPLASPPGRPRSKRVAGNTSRRSSSRREKGFMARPLRRPLPVLNDSRRLRR